MTNDCMCSVDTHTCIVDRFLFQCKRREKEKKAEWITPHVKFYYYSIRLRRHRLHKIGFERQIWNDSGGSEWNETFEFAFRTVWQWDRQWRTMLTELGKMGKRRNTELSWKWLNLVTCADRGKLHAINLRLGRSNRYQWNRLDRRRSSRVSAAFPWHQASTVINMAAQIVWSMASVQKKKQTTNGNHKTQLLLF